VLASVAGLGLSGCVGRFEGSGRRRWRTQFSGEYVSTRPLPTSRCVAVARSDGTLGLPDRRCGTWWRCSGPTTRRSWRSNWRESASGQGVMPVDRVVGCVSRSRALTLYVIVPCTLFGALFVGLFAVDPALVQASWFRVVQAGFALVFAGLLYWKRAELQPPE
jgi:hypothetical protein